MQASGNAVHVAGFMANVQQAAESSGFSYSSSNVFVTDQKAASSLRSSRKIPGSAVQALVHLACPGTMGAASQSARISQISRTPAIRSATVSTITILRRMVVTSITMEIMMP